jgi:hypothetical protein
VIASFVLGLGDSADEIQPNSSFSIAVDSSVNQVDITLSDGDTISEGELFFRGDGIGSSFSYSDLPGDPLSGDQWDVGETISLHSGSGSGQDITTSSPGGPGSSWSSGGTLRLVWESSSSDDASTLAEQDIDF